MDVKVIYSKSDYENKYETLREEFFNYNPDFDEGEFIKRQIELYKDCVKSSSYIFDVFGGAVIEDTYANMTGIGFIAEVDSKIRDEGKRIDPDLAKSLNFSFRKIIQYLENKRKEIKLDSNIGFTATQYALYHYTLQKSKIKPWFQEKKKEFQRLGEEYGKHWNNLQTRYNVINNSNGQEGYTSRDVTAVKNLLKTTYPEAIHNLEEISFKLF